MKAKTVANICARCSMLSVRQFVCLCDCPRRKYFHRFHFTDEETKPQEVITHPRSHWEGPGWGVSSGKLALHPLHLATRPHSFRQRGKQGNVREWLMGTTFHRLTEGLPEWHVTYERWTERALHENINRRRMFLELLWFRIKTPCSKKANNILKSTTLNIQD